MTTDPGEARLGRYTIRGLLGQGGMARVYRATLKGPMGFNKEVALKQIRIEGLNDDRSALEALIDEARIGSRLRHPNIVETWEFGEEGGAWFIAMEYVDGLTLDAIIRGLSVRGATLPLPVVFDLFEQVCRGLHAAHTTVDEHGEPLRVVHRDLKPSNIIVSRTGVAKVLDFGIAKAATRIFHTRSLGTAKGTPWYMSPEQIEGQPLDHRSDLFSLGSVLYEAVTGRRLCAAVEMAAAFFKIVSGDVEDECTELDSLLPGLGDVLRRCLALDPADRWPDARALRDALGALRPDSWRGGPEPGDVIAALIEVAGSSPGGKVAELERRTDRTGADWQPLVAALRAAPPAGDPLSAARELLPVTSGSLPSAWSVRPGSQSREVAPVRPPESAPPAEPPPPTNMPPPPTRGPSRTTAVLALALAAAAAVLLLVYARAVEVFDVEIEGLDDAGGLRTRLRFVDRTGAVLVSHLVDGEARDGGVVIRRDPRGQIRHVAVATQGMTDPSRTGQLALFEVDGPRVTERFRVESADIGWDTPEAHFASASKLYHFRSPAFVTTERGKPHVLVIAKDQVYAANWLLRFDLDGGVRARVYHPGDVARMLLTDDAESLVLWGVNNRFCPGGTAPCPKLYGGTVIVGPVPQPSRPTSLPPACGPLPQASGLTSLRFGPGHYTVNDGRVSGRPESPFEISVRQRGANCTHRVHLSARGEIVGTHAVGGCDTPLEVTVNSPPFDALCTAWETAEDRAGAPALVATPGARVADVMAEWSGEGANARVTVRFLDKRGGLIDESRFPGGARPPDKEGHDLRVLRDAAGRPTWALLGLRTSPDRLLLWDLREGAPRLAVDQTFFADNPIAAGVAPKAYQFKDWFLRAGGPTGEEPPEIVALAGDDLYYLSWLVRLDAEGEVVGRRFHLGQLEVLEELEDGWVAAAGSANAEPDHESGTNPFVVWAMPLPGDGEVSELPPRCGGLPVTPRARGHTVLPSTGTVTGIDPLPDGFEVVGKQHDAPGCWWRIRFTRTGALTSVTPNPAVCPNLIEVTELPSAWECPG